MAITQEELELIEKHMVLCEFGDYCSECDEPEGRTWFENTSYEYPDEGNHYCDDCAINEINRQKDSLECFCRALALDTPTTQPTYGDVISHFCETGGGCQ